MKSELQIFSPSRVLRRIGKHTGEGLYLGIEDMAGRVSQASSHLADNAIADIPDYELDMDINSNKRKGSGSGQGESSNSGDINITFTGDMSVRSDVDIMRLARQLADFVDKDRKGKGQG